MWETLNFMCTHIYNVGKIELYEHIDPFWTNSFKCFCCMTNAQAKINKTSPILKSLMVAVRTMSLPHI